MDAELARIATELRSRYKDQIRHILFFGSRARGEATPESDYDCLMIVKQPTAALKQDLDRLSNQWLLERGIVFAWIALSEADLERLRFEPFIRNAYREGIAA